MVRAAIAALLGLSLLLAGYALGAGASKAEARRCTVEAPADTLSTVTVLIYYACDGGYRAIPRQVATASTVEALLTAALRELLKGPSMTERAVGFTSFFSTETDGMLKRVLITDDGRATVDFRDFSPYVPNASTTAGLFALNSQLFRTIFQFPAVREVIFQFDGSCEAFYAWTQAVSCEPVTREQWEQRTYDWL